MVDVIQIQSVHTNRRQMPWCVRARLDTPTLAQHPTSLALVRYFRLRRKREFHKHAAHASRLQIVAK